MKRCLSPLGPCAVHTLRDAIAEGAALLLGRDRSRSNQFFADTSLRAPQAATVSFVGSTDICTQ
jgi:hypothetical protein